MESKLAGKTVLITEATRNFGKDLALAFAAEGSNLMLASRDNPELLEQTAREVQALGVQVSKSQCDLSNESQVEDMVGQCVSQLGSLEVVVNNVLFPMPLQSLEEEVRCGDHRILPAVQAGDSPNDSTGVGAGVEFHRVGRI